MRENCLHASEILLSISFKALHMAEQRSAYVVDMLELNQHGKDQRGICIGENKQGKDMGTPLGSKKIAKFKPCYCCDCKTYIEVLHRTNTARCWDCTIQYMKQVRNKLD